MSPTCMSYLKLIGIFLRFRLPACSPSCLLAPPPPPPGIGRILPHWRQLQINATLTITLARPYGDRS